MAARLKVLFCGDSLVLAGLRSTLAGSADLDLIDLDGAQLSAQLLNTLQPNVVVYAAGDLQPECHFDLSEQLPGLLLVGIEASTNRVEIWSGRQLRELSISQLAATIANQCLQPPIGEFGAIKA